MLWSCHFRAIVIMRSQCVNSIHAIETDFSRSFDISAMVLHNAEVPENQANISRSQLFVIKPIFNLKGIIVKAQSFNPHTTISVTIQLLDKRSQVINMAISETIGYRSDGDLAPGGDNQYFWG